MTFVWTRAELNDEQSEAVREAHSVFLVGVVVLFVQIGALCSKNALHDKHLRFWHLRALRTFRADWCA